jgi:Fe-Mn family superoxide dismutase
MIKMSDILLEAKGFSLPSLPYAYNALEPHIDAETMEEHHKKHHKGYVTKLNDALKSKAAQNLTIEEVLANVKKYDDKVRNNAGGVFNHTLYFNLLSPNATTSPVGELKKELEKTFSSFAKFKEEFTEAGTGRFGSGWVWLSLTREGLKIHSTPNQDNPLMSYSEVKGEPIIGMDVWEHAYYLKHRSQRAKYISDFFKVLDWNKAEENYQKILNRE